MKLLQKLLITVFSITSATLVNASPWVDDYEALLQKYVVKDGVKYSKWKKNEADLASLKSITEQIGDAKVSGSKEEQKAFYINAYNAWVLQQALNRWPTKSVFPNGKGDFFTKKQIKVNRRKMSFNELEKQIIFGKFFDSRIHFAINCASEGCPPLSNKAFRASNLDSHLDELTKTYVNSGGISYSKGKITASSIFLWYENDFKKSSGSVIKFVNEYRDEKLPKKKVTYYPYSWNVNAKK